MFSSTLRRLFASLNRAHLRGCRPAARPRRAQFQPQLELLEGRCLPALFLVTTTADAGFSSLRQAILCSNATPGLNTIDFDIPGGGVQTIEVGSVTGEPLPAITNAVTIDGYSQPGTYPNSLTHGDNALLHIQLAGSSLSFGDGLDVFTGGVTVDGLVVDQFPNQGIVISGANASGDAIAGNFVGIDPTGTIAEGNGWSGIVVSNSANGNTIGGATPGGRNVSSGNGNSGVGIYSAGVANVVEGNLLGTNALGTAAVANQWDGVTIYDSGGNVVGGSGAGNVCSGNLNRGVDIFGTGSTGNVVEGNLLGANAIGTIALGNH